MPEAANRRANATFQGKTRRSLDLDDDAHIRVSISTKSKTTAFYDTLVIHCLAKGRHRQALTSTKTPKEIQAHRTTRFPGFATTRSSLVALSWGARGFWAVELVLSDVFNNGGCN